MSEENPAEPAYVEAESVSEEDIREQVGLGLFERYLPLWVAICMVIGIVLALTVPGVSVAIDQLQVAGISIPIGISLFLMMYPSMLNIEGEELKNLGRNPKPIILTLFSNWVVAPSVGVALANLFLGGNPQLIVAIILLSSSPCTAMVLVWGYLAKGNQEQNIINTSLNTVSIMVLYAPVVALFTGISSIAIDQWLLVISVVVFIGAPLLLGVASKKILIDRKGAEWFHDRYRPAVGKVGLIALLVTLIVLFSLNGKVMLENPDLLVLVSIPLLLGFAIVVGYNLLITRTVGLAYEEGVTSVIIGSSSHFEIAIATAVSMYGVGSIAALGTTMGLFWEVPVMLGLVYLARYLRRKRFWKGEPL